jgi:hypothetical protein
MPTRGGNRKRPASAPRSALDRISGFPGPRQQFVKTVDRVPVDHAREHVMEVGVGLDVVKLAGLNQRTQHGPSMAAPIAAGEEMILATEGNRPDRPFNRVGIEFDAAIMQEACQTVPARERVADRFGKRAAAWYRRKLRFKPDAQSVDDWLRAAAASREPVCRRLTANVGVDGIEFADLAQRLYC